jgi:hypothetical protein
MLDDPGDPVTTASKNCGTSDYWMPAFAGMTKV